MESNRRNLFEQFRKDFPEFTYEGYSYVLRNRELHIHFDFRMGDKYSFKPWHIFYLPEKFNDDQLSDSLFRNIVFNLGMIELISYWKTACPPRVVIKPARLTEEQLNFWKKTYQSGLAEFFYVNGIPTSDDFMEIESTAESYFEYSDVLINDPDAVLVPLGGGKDSVVTLEMLSGNRSVRPYIMNPRPASMETAARAGYAMHEVITSERKIDPLLLQLNEEGFLNGHTPFSAMLAFTTILVSYLHGIPEIALSNESSANEPTIPGTNINHQYSKSLEFENDFRKYVNEYLCGGIQYYSYLRPLNELQIAKLFSSFPKHLESFRSCNVGSKTDSWCGQCPKCLFTYIILSPFIDQTKLTQIFGKNLFEDGSLTGLMEQLCGIADEKPFECIGTVDEVNAAVRYFIHHKMSGEAPALIQHYKQKTGKHGPADDDYNKLLHSFGVHNIPGKKVVNLLKGAINVS